MAISVAKGTKLTIGGKAAGKGIAVMCSSTVLAICGRVLSVLPLKLDNRK